MAEIVVNAQPKPGGHWYACSTCGLSRVSTHAISVHLIRTHLLGEAEAYDVLFQARRVAKIQEEA